MCVRKANIFLIMSNIIFLKFASLLRFCSMRDLDSYMYLGWDVSLYITLGKLTECPWAGKRNDWRMFRSLHGRGVENLAKHKPTS